MIKQCRHCGSDFEVDENNHHQRKIEYCSDKCRHREHDLRKRGGPVRIEKVCEECGKPYIAGRRDSVTCSRECNYERNKRRVRDRGAYYREKYRAERILQEEKAKRKKKKIESIDQIQKKAQAMGMSYGQYMAQLYIQKGAYK
jgi:hypothetical protein